MLAVSLTAVLLATAPGAAEADFERVVAAAPGSRVELDLDLGDGLRPDRGFVSISTQASNEVSVLVRTDGWGSWNVQSTLDVKPERTRVDVRVAGASAWLFGGPQVRIEVRVPEQAQVEVRSRGAALRVADLRGALRARVREADVELRGMRGPVRLHVVGGDAELSELQGDLEVSAAGGDVDASWVSGMVEARTSDGDIALQEVSGAVTAKALAGKVTVSQAHGPVSARSEDGDVAVSFAASASGSIESADGDVSVTLPENAALALDARATRGRVEVAAGIPWRGERGERQAVGAIGGGGARLVVRSSDGVVRISGR